MGHAQGIRHWYEFENFWLQPHLPGASGLTTENAWRLNNISQARSYAPSNVSITHRKFKDYPTIQIIQYVPYSVVAYKVSQIVRKHYMSFKNYPDSEVHVIQKQERKQHFVFITNKNNWGKKKVTNYLKKHSWSYEIWSHNPSGSGIVVTWTEQYILGTHGLYSSYTMHQGGHHRGSRCGSRWCPPRCKLGVWVWGWGVVGSHSHQRAIWCTERK